MKTAGDKPWELIFDPENDQILVCAKLARDVLAEGLAMPYDSPLPILSMDQAQKHANGTWRVEVWAPTEKDARRLTHEQLRKRRAVTLGETR